jgi:hypothetical protein
MIWSYDHCLRWNANPTHFQKIHMYSININTEVQKKLIVLKNLSQFFCTPFPCSLLVLFHDVHGHKVCDINLKIYMMI